MKQSRFLCSLFLCLLCLTGCRQESAQWERVQPATKVYETEAEAGQVKKIRETEETAQVTVHVCGAVRQPGVYTLPEGARLVDAVKMAGGFREDADERWCNQAREIADQEQIVIYSVDETAGMTMRDRTDAGAAGDAALRADDADGDKINLNTASKQELMSLPGVGASRAQAIMDYREKQGGFGSIEEVMQISGIKHALFEKIKDRITV